MNAHAPVADPVARPSGGMLSPFAPLFHNMLDRIDAGLAAGSLDMSLPDGRRRLLGGRGEGPVAIVDLHSWRALVRLANAGSSGWYVGWGKGEWRSPDPVALFELFALNRVTLGEAGRARGLGRVIHALFNRLHRNTRSGARRNVAAHYDLGNDFYSLWLDPTGSYSSAMFSGPGEPLEIAQQRKLAAILDRTQTKPGDMVLEIGCGWGSFVETAAASGRAVHAITLSAEQKRWVDGKNLPQATVLLTDYRDITGRYDAIASIEMVEAVGQDYWPDYLEAIARLLKPGGRAAIQYIAIDDAIFASYARNIDFIQRHIFPGGMLLSESRFRAFASAAGLGWEDRQAFGADYAETLRRWRVAFDSAVATGTLPARFDSHFIQLWRYYLMYCEGAFRGGSVNVAQVTLVKL